MNCFHYVSNIKQNKKEKSINRESKTTNDEQSSKNNEHKQEQDHTKDNNRPRHSLFMATSPQLLWKISKLVKN